MSETSKTFKTDILLIATNLGVGKTIVYYVAKELRIKRNTSVQQAVKQALAYRNKQNEEFVAYCSQIAVNKVCPK